MTVSRYTVISREAAEADVTDALSGQLIDVVLQGQRAHIDRGEIDALTSNERTDLFPAHPGDSYPGQAVMPLNKLRNAGKRS